MVKKGFTLLELLVVISIIGILVAVAAASYSSAQIKARNSRRMSDLKNIQNAAEQYYSDNGMYPNSSAAADFPATYLPAGWPDDPKPVSGYDYVYNPDFLGAGTYLVCAKMEGSSVYNATNKQGANYPTTAGDCYCLQNLQ